MLVEAGQPLAARLATGTLAAAASVRDRASSVAAASQRLARPEWGFASLDQWLTRWRVAGAVFALLGVALLLAIGLVP